MRRIALIAALALLAAGCGSDGNQDDGAQAFIDCFKAPGYLAAKPAVGKESGFAVEAAKEGYPNAAVNIQKSKDALLASVYLIFFEDERKAQMALDQLGRETASDIPPQQRGQAVIAYTSVEDKARTEKAVNGCL